MMESTPLISVRGLSKKFSRDIHRNLYYGLLDMLGLGSASGGGRPELRKSEFWATDEVDLDLFSGEILGIVGMNGSGKTTLMRLIANIYPVDSGSIKGKPGLKITATFALKSGMQPLFTGRENIYIKGSMYGMSKQEIDDKMDFISEFSELGEKLNQPFGTYSSGMQARLSYSIAVATEPDVFIIDESLAVGDSAFKAKCFERLKSFVQAPGKAVLFVSNHINKVLKVATRVVVMKKGKKIYESSDIQAALEFYIQNSVDELTDEKQQQKIRKIRDYEF